MLKPTEEWRDVPGTNGKYQASIYGQVRSSKKVLAAYSRGRRDSSYLAVSINGEKEYVHRVIALTFIGPPNGLHVNHIDGNPANNWLCNLEYCTPKENSKHAKECGLVAKRRESRITEEKKLAIGTSPLSDAETAKKFGVCVRTVSRCRRKARNQEDQ